MAYSTVGLVSTKDKDVQKIAIKVHEVIREIACEHETRINPNRFVNPTYHPLGHFFVFKFKDGKDERQLFVHMGCDADFRECHKGCGDSGIILTLGDWGNSVQLITAFLDNMKDMGDTFLIESDCSDKPPVKL